MHGSRIYRAVVLLTALIVFCVCTAYFSWVEEHSCMGVRLLTQEQRDAYTEYAYADLSPYLEFNGEPAAVDTASSTIYISQDVMAGTQANTLPGSLTITHRDYTLQFAPDDRFADLAAAIAEGYSFSLLAISGNDTYMEYRVIFTTLPVMRLDGFFSHLNPDEREVMLGDVCLWAANDPTTGRYSVKTSTTEWHVRGGTTAYQDKKPWKLSLKKDNLDNNNVDFLGLGADDDWILNSMSIDDTKIKENLFMGLWNAWADQVSWNRRMSTGTYVELVLNQSYEGVYLLQRRIDDKYLQLEPEDILLKGGPLSFPEDLASAYEIRYSPLPAEETLSLMEGFFTGEDVSILDLDNFLDINLFLQYASAMDNAYCKNVFYVLERESAGYRLSLLPWDTDLSWGVIWTDNGFQYDYEESITAGITRQEYMPVSRQFPELHLRMAERWKLLRQNLLTEAYVLSLVEEMAGELQRSGVIHREWERWDPFFGDADTLESLKMYLQDQLTRMDELYEQLYNYMTNPGA